ncbi:MAG: NAD(P)H-hydrate epimerase [Rhodobacteraceae bacterium]|nr:NAD(P)H-hydrate epimerase [Paracoccaceae bacterium]
MTELLTAAQMRAIEQAAIESGEVTGLELMERAGRSVVKALLEEWPEMAKAPQKAVVLCGPGNNGGDGFVVARLLKERGWEVGVFLYGDVDRLPSDAKVNCERWREMGEVHPACPLARGVKADSLPPSCDLLVDAVFGTGLKRPVDDPCLWEWFWLIDDAVDVLALEGLDPDKHGGVKWQASRTVAVDMPSGLCSDSGMVSGGEPEHGLRAPRVMLSVTFHGAKRGHRLADGPALCGKLVICDIGLDKWADAAEGVR